MPFIHTSYARFEKTETVYHFLSMNYYNFLKRALHTVPAHSPGLLNTYSCIWRLKENTVWCTLLWDSPVIKEP